MHIVMSDNSYNVNFPSTMHDRIRGWMNVRDTRLVKAYTAISETAAGTSGTNTIVASLTVAAKLFPGMLIRVKGVDVYTVSAVSTVTITTVETLVQTYIADTIEREQVSILYDRIASNSYEQATGAKQGFYNAKGINNRPAIGLNSADANLLSTAGFNLDIPTVGLTMAFVGQLILSIAAGASLRRIFTCPSVDNAAFVRQSSSNLELKAVNPNDSRVTASIANYDNTTAFAAVITMRKNNREILLSSGAKSYLNSSAQGTALTGATAAWGIGDSAAGGLNPSIWIGEVIMLHGASTQDEMASIMNYLKVGWGVA